jgi:hypothetical protein
MMKSYFVAFERNVPTGRFFVPWTVRTDSVVIEVPNPIATEADRAGLCSLVAEAICVTDPKMGRGVTLDHWAAELFMEQAEVARGIRIVNIQPL